VRARIVWIPVESGRLVWGWVGEVPYLMRQLREGLRRRALRVVGGRALAVPATSVTPVRALKNEHRTTESASGIAKLIKRCSDGAGDQGAEEALRGQLENQPRPSPVRAALLSARPGPLPP
jgi:hypothetical protein